MAAVVEWPSVGYEDLTWRSQLPPDVVPRRIRERHAGPYRAAVVAEIAHRTPSLTSGVLALLDEATAEISRFDAQIGAELAPFATVLLRSESASSSRIENLTSGARSLALAELGDARRSNAAEIVGNVAAMRAALQLADRVDADAILQMHRALMGGPPDDGTEAGRWRTEQVWIGGDSYGPHGAAYVAPHHTRVPAAIADLEAFLCRADLPLLAQVALAHAQFESIHPFADGNGRTGRALVHAVLRGRGLTRQVTVPVSAGLLTDTGAYFHALDAYRTGDVEPILVSFAEAAFAAVLNGRRLVADLAAVRSDWDERIRARRDASAWRLADLLLRQPVLDAPTVARELGLPAANALRPIAPLVEAGVLTEFTGFRRNRLWQAREVLDALDAFADRAVRRAG